jgi:hypothetical protein
MTNPNQDIYNAALEKGVELAVATLRSWAGGRLSTPTQRALFAAANDLDSNKREITAAHRAEVTSAAA